MGGFGSGGRNKKSLQRKQFEGSYQGKAPGKRVVDSTLPTCPEWLSSMAKKEWRRVVPELVKLGLLTKLDRASLGLYCQTYAHYLDCENVLTEGGLTYEFTNKSGAVNLVQRPEARLSQSYLKLLNTLCQNFGFTPSSRGQMEIPDLSKTEDDEFEAFLNRSRDE